MSPLANTLPEADPADPARLQKICTAIRGKLQFMDYLVRAAVADVERFQAEGDPGNRIFLRQLIEMHASNLSVECENMRLMGDLCHQIEMTLDESPLPSPIDSPRALANGDAA
ncbi:MAG: hypothetical protein U0800_08705 [Isosphaeraceae bacterium]